ncbi:type II secretion system protein [Campylobacter blaseri]
MIELIFVIVILGILAAVAIPRLAATRDDAEVAKSLSNLGTAVSDITANYTAQGSFDTDEISAFTNVEGITYKDDNKKLTALKSAGAQTVTLNYKAGKTTDCAAISLIKNTENEISIFIGTSKTIALQEAISEAEAKVVEAKDKTVGSGGYTDEAAKQKAVTEAEEAVTKAKENLKSALSSKGDSLIPDGADSSCRSFVRASSFQDMAAKSYRLSGSRVRF